MWIFAGPFQSLALSFLNLMLQAAGGFGGAGQLMGSKAELRDGEKQPVPGGVPLKPSPPLEFD